MGYIYKITNLTNGKIYIGQTRYTVAHRYSQHWSNAFEIRKNTQKDSLYSEMKALGKTNFQIEVVEKVSNNKLNEREKYWIKYFNSYENGYNRTRGGAGNYIGKTIYCFTLSGKLYKIYTDINEAALELKIPKDNIQNALHRKNGTARGYQWRFEEDKEKILDYTNYNKNLGTINTLTLQYDLNGNFITSYPTIEEAVNATGAQSSGIVRCINGEIAFTGGFLWRRGFYGEEIPQKIKGISLSEKYKTKGKCKKVICENKKILKHYNNLSEASREEHLSRDKITYCCDIYPRTTCNDGRRFKYEESQ